MNKPLILVVEDDAPVRSLIATTLKTHDYKYLSAQNGAGAITEALSHNPDVVLLDLGLPDMDGVDVIRKIRSWSNMPIIVISARTEDSDKIEALDAGADDYLTKPFNILEVRARIRTVLRRAGGHVVQEQKIIRVHDMEVNLVKRTVTLGGEEVRLTAKEFDLLQMFITNRGRPFSRKEMLEAVWKYDDYTGDARTVDVHIRRLREKIERNPDEPEFIFTKWKVGYYFTDKD